MSVTTQIQSFKQKSDRSSHILVKWTNNKNHESRREREVVGRKRRVGERKRQRGVDRENKERRRSSRESRRGRKR